MDAADGGFVATTRKKIGIGQRARLGMKGINIRLVGADPERYVYRFGITWSTKKKVSGERPW